MPDAAAQASNSEQRMIEQATKRSGPIWLDRAEVRVAVMLALFVAAAAYECTHLTTLTDPDVWWHLRTGTWILQNHSVPHHALFTQHISLPWIDASWGFDLLLGMLYQALNLAALPVTLMALQTAIAAGLFFLASGSAPNFWPAVALAGLAQLCLVPMQLRPGLISLLFLALELAVLFSSRRRGDTRALCWLPLLFAVWVNCDRQFIYGLAALALFCGEAGFEQLSRTTAEAGWRTDRPAIPIRWLSGVAIACLLATLASPYTYHLYGLVWESATRFAIDPYLQEFHAMRFRRPQDYLLMLLVMAAFFAAGRLRSRGLFPIALLVVCAVISFRIQRDTWLAVVASVAVIGDAIASTAREGPQARIARLRGRELVLTAVLVSIVLVVLTLRLSARQPMLMAKVSENFPVRACDFIRQNRLPQPIFNPYTWGGFLTWYLPEYPVAIDGRIDLYGDALDIPYFELMTAKIPLQSHADFANAQTILLEANSPLAEALSTVLGFHVAYQDDQAIVLLR